MHYVRLLIMSRQKLFIKSVKHKRQNIPTGVNSELPQCGNNTNATLFNVNAVMLRIATVANCFFNCVAQRKKVGLLSAH